MQNVNKVSRKCRIHVKMNINLLISYKIYWKTNQSKTWCRLGNLLCTLFFALSLYLSSFQTRVKADCTVD